MTAVETGIVDEQIRLEWRQTCGLAVKALIRGKDFNDVVNEAIEEFLSLPPHEQVLRFKRG